MMVQCVIFYGLIQKKPQAGACLHAVLAFYLAQMLFNNSMQRLIDDEDEDSLQNWFEDQFMVVNWYLNNTINTNGKSRSEQHFPVD